MAPKKDEKCEYCGMMFVKVKSHYSHCAVRQITLEAEAQVGEDGTVDSDEPIMRGSTTEIEVPGSATEGLITDRFWAWTEGFSVQMGILIDSFTGITAELREIKEILNESKNNAGNSYIALKDIKQHLSIVSTSFADAFEVIKHGKIIDEDRIEELKKKKPIRKSSPGFESASKTQEEADLEAFEATQEVETSGVVSGVVSYEDDNSLPEHTRKIPAAIKIATEKAVQLLFYNGKEAWIPRSTINGTPDYENKGDNATQQNFIINSWVLKKNQVIADNE